MRLRPQPLLERIPLAGPVSVAVREFRHPAFVYPWHQHPEMELTWVLAGSGLRYVGDSIAPFHAGDFCLLGGNLPHTWLSPSDPTPPARSLVVQFDPTRWGSALLDLPEFVKIADLFARTARGLRFDPALAVRLRPKITRRASPLGRFAALLEILEELAEQPDSTPLTLAPWPRHRSASADKRIRTVLTYLAKNAGGPIAQRDAARLVRLSPAAFSRFFRRAVGKTFCAYLTDLRLSDACRRLLESDDSVSEIAFATGFENLSTFNRAFRHSRSMSPREFRRQARLPGRSAADDLTTAAR